MEAEMNYKAGLTNTMKGNSIAARALLDFKVN